LQQKLVTAEVAEEGSGDRGGIQAGKLHSACFQKGLRRNLSLALGHLHLGEKPRPVAGLEQWSGLEYRPRAALP
jgi:hypothetical protein